MNIRAGTLKTYNPDKGFGFVTVNEYLKDVFLHISNVKNIESQLGTSPLKLWIETSTNNRGTYVSKAWASRDEIPPEYLKILTEQEEKHAAIIRDQDARQELKINGTQLEHKAREELMSRVIYLDLCTGLQAEEEGISSLCVTGELYQILLNRMRGLQTTSFNHGNGVERYYTHNYCLQRTYGHSGIRDYIKRGGRPFPRSVDKSKYSNKTVKVCTPSFEDMCRGILRDYRSDVLYINR